MGLSKAMWLVEGAQAHAVHEAPVPWLFPVSQRQKVHLCSVPSLAVAQASKRQASLGFFARGTHSLTPYGSFCARVEGWALSITARLASSKVVSVSHFTSLAWTWCLRPEAAAGDVWALWGHSFLTGVKRQRKCMLKSSLFCKAIMQGSCYKLLRYSEGVRGRRNVLRGVKEGMRSKSTLRAADWAQHTGFCCFWIAGAGQSWERGPGAAPAAEAEAECLSCLPSVRLGCCLSAYPWCCLCITCKYIQPASLREPIWEEMQFLNGVNPGGRSFTGTISRGKSFLWNVIRAEWGRGERSQNVSCSYLGSCSANAGAAQESLLQSSPAGVRALQGPGTELGPTAAFYITTEKQQQQPRRHCGQAAVSGHTQSPSNLGSALSVQTGCN